MHSPDRAACCFCLGNAIYLLDVTPSNTLDVISSNPLPQPSPPSLIPLLFLRGDKYTKVNRRGGGTRREDGVDRSNDI